MSRSDGGPCPGSSLPGGRGCHVTSGASFPPSTTSDFSRGRWAVLGTLCSVPTEVVRAPSTYVLAQSQGHPPPGAGAAVGAEEIQASRLTHVFVFQMVNSLKRKLGKLVHGYDLDPSATCGCGIV